MTQETEIHLLKNNQKRELSDLEWLDEFYKFLQGEVPEGMQLAKGSNVKLSPRSAFSVIWYLQEHLPVFPDKIEQCSVCKELYDSYSEGFYDDKKLKHYCDSCL